MYLCGKEVCVPKFLISYIFRSVKKRVSIDGNCEYVIFQTQNQYKSMYNACILWCHIQKKEDKKKKKESACKWPIITVRVVLLMIWIVWIYSFEFCFFFCFFTFSDERAEKCQWIENVIESLIGVSPLK